MCRQARTVLFVVGALLLGTLVSAVRLVTAAAAPSGPTPASPVCGVADLGSVAPPAQAAPTQPAEVIAQGMTMSALGTDGSRIYALDAEARTLKIYGLDGASVGGFAVPWRIRAYSMAVDSSGAVYLARYPSTVVKLSSTGTEVWARDVDHEIVGLYGVAPGGTFRVGATMMSQTGSVQLNADGSAAGVSPITGTAFSATPDGGVMATDGSYVRRYGPTGAQQLIFGDDRAGEPKAASGEPYRFYQQGGAAVAPDSTIVVADATRGIHSVGAEGFYRGVAPDDKLGFLTERSWLVPVGDRLYYSAGARFNGNQTISWVSFADLKALAEAPRTPEPVLGFGAGLVTGMVGQYVPPGRPPTVSASFDPWWAGTASGLSLRYTIRERRQVVAQAGVPATTVALPTSASALDSIPLRLPSTRPGAYEVSAQLVTSAGATVGSTCLRYTIGAPGHRLDFASLPTGAGHGGPAPPRAVALADQLGIGSVRMAVEWNRLLPDPNGAMDFSHYDAAFVAAAEQARTRGVNWWVQVGEGKAIERALVADGTWEARVRELVTHFRALVPTWEAWNEPNNSFGPADVYVSKVLIPFSRAVRGADPAAKIVGASVLDMDLAYFDGIGKAGGYPLMDYVGLHPYPGHNRSLEEHAVPPAIAALRPLLERWGAGSKPIWVTELAWWADGPGSYYAQADKVARMMIWGRALGVDKWTYLMTEAAYGDYGLSYSFIQATSEPDYVKPAALATMTAAGQLNGRPFTGMPPTGIPHAYAATFGARTSGGDTVLTAWTDDLNTSAVVTANISAQVTITDILGDTTLRTVGPTTPLPIDLSGSPSYVSAPAGVTLTLRPAETFGRNVALATGGATASATSATSANPPAQAIDGVADAMVRGDLVGLPGWASGPGDQAPALTVRLPAVARLNRVLLSAHSNGSIVPGLRNYEVAVEEPGAGWRTVAKVTDQFHTRMALIPFSARDVSAIRITVLQVNYSGYTGGSEPWFWPQDGASLSDSTTPWFGPAFIYEVEGFEPGTTIPTPTTPTTTAPTTTTTKPPLLASSFAARRPSDFDGDGRQDVALWRPSKATYFVVPSSVGYGYSRPVGGVGDVAVPGDFDGDGKDELALWRPFTGTWSAVNTSNGHPWTLVLGIAGDVPVQADYDGDKRDDIAVWRPASGAWWILESGTGTMKTSQLGLPGDIPVPADYDRDGRIDIAVWRPGTGTSFIVQSSTGLTVNRQLGQAGDVAASGDYDGDGWLDSAVWRPGSGTWFIVQSSTGLTVTRQLGQTGDVAVPGDYDADGRTDVAVWRPATGVWTSIRSDGSTWSMPWGESGDVPV